ncbi:MAG: hypothetical protein DRI90_20590 [Deltaproteobacteria bacterium]|nr:MAG: hypothetical protein DRI90_20590 [Deltaproteobacteria bacterium]
MPVQITIRNVPTAVRNELAARAALEGRSMQEYLRGELERLAKSPPVGRWLAEVRKRKEASATHVSARAILNLRDEDRV